MSLLKIFMADFGSIMKKDVNNNSQSNGDSDMRPVKVALKVEKKKDGSWKKPTSI
jgi:hypothetical protein